MMGIGEFITGFLNEHRLSRSALAEMLGYRSKTSIDRLINGNARPESVQKFEEALQKAFALTSEERRALRDAAETAIFGRKRYLANREIWRFIQGEAQADDGLRIVDSESRQSVALARRYAGAAEVRLYIMNCQYVSGLFGLIAGLLQRENATAEHFIYVDDDDARTIRAVSALMPVFYSRGYEGYARRKEPPDGTWECGLSESDLMIALWTDAEQVARTDVIVFTEADMGVLVELPPVDAEVLALIGFDKAGYQPIKRNYFGKSAFEDYIQYSADYAALERNHAIWKIKPDLCVDQIPAWILRKAVEEGPAPREAGFEKVLDALEEIYRKRYQNTWSKHRHAYSVYKRSAMYRFAMTGRTTDHFWMMRPYTPEERVIILTELLNQQMNNPYVHMVFLKDDDMVRDVEIAYYEGEGMLILEANTDYNLGQGHTEVMVTHREMLDLYRDFYMNVLIREHVYPESETCNYLRYLISEIRHQARQT